MLLATGLYLSFFLTSQPAFAQIDGQFYTEYRTYDEVAGAAGKLETLLDRYKNSTDLDIYIESIGQSHEFKEMEVLRFTAPSTYQSSKPALFLRAGLHAAEQVGVLSSMYAVEKLLYEYETGVAETVELLKKIEIIYMPLQNPDGYNFFREQRDSANPDFFQYIIHKKK